jgi:glycosyltransferase 2 family protein
MNQAMRSRLGLALRILFGVVGLAFMGIAFRDTWDRSRHEVLPPAWALALSLVLALAGLVSVSRGWIGLFEGQASPVALARGFYTAQLGKYIPGAIWQAMGQVGLARRAGATGARALTAYPVVAATQAAAGGTVGAGLALAGTYLSTWLRVAPLSGLLMLFVLRRGWMVRAARFAERVTRWRPVDEAVPSQAGIAGSYLWNLVGVLAMSSGFAVLASTIHATRTFPAAVTAFAVAWTAGYLAVPFPAGLGVREAVLIATLASPGGAAPVIAASLAFRLVTMLSELAMIAFARIRG